VSNTTNITVNALPTLSANGGGAASVCINATTAAFTNAQTGGTWSIVAGTGTASVSTGGVVTGLTAGTVSVKYTYSNGTCSNSVSSSVTVNASATASAGGNGTLAICSGTTLTTALLYGALTGSPASGGTWSPTLAGAGTYTYKQTGIAPCGNNTATVVVSINTNTITLPGNYPNSSVVSGQNTTITPGLVSTGFSSITAYSTSSFKGVLTVNQTSGVVSVTDAKPAGNYLITVIAFSGSCQKTTSFTLTVTNPNANCEGTTANTDYPMTGALYDVKIGDFNNDGKQDIATVNYNSNNFAVRLGNGLGGFAAKTDYTVGSNPTSLAIGDFNRDGNQDIAISNYGSNSVSICLGNGSGTFGTVTHFAVANGPIQIALGDFNRDGILDFVTSNYGASSISICLGNGTGGFSVPTNMSSGSYTYGLVVGDFNGDGNSDIAVTADQKACIFLGDGIGGFGPKSLYPMGPTNMTMRRLVVADFNNDGIQDLAAANYGSSNFGTYFSYRFGDGLGGFGNDITLEKSVSCAYRIESLAVGDFNGDGKQDIVAADYFGTFLSVCLNDGYGGFGLDTTGLFGNAIQIQNYYIENVQGVFALDIGDFNGDGFQDIAAAKYAAGNVSIILASPIIPTITAGSATTFCSGSSVVLTASAGSSYLWSNGATTQSITVTTAGSYTVRVTNASGCRSPASAATVVTVIALPTAPISGNTSFCTGGNTVLTSTATAGSGTISSYQWQVGGINVASGGTSATYTATAAGSYTVTVTNSNGCSFTSSAYVVSVNALPTAPISGNTSFCTGGNTVLTSTATAGSGSISSYQWKIGGVNVASGGTSAIYTATAAGSYTVTVTNSNGCSFTSSAYVVTLNALPTAPNISAGGATTFCSGGSVILNGVVNATLGNALDFDGSNDFVNIPSSASPFTGNADHTIEFNVLYKGGQTGDRWIVWYGLPFANNTQEVIGYNGETGKIKIHHVSTNNDITATTAAITPNVWTHVALVYTGSSRTTAIYINGVLVETFSFTANLAIPTNAQIQLGTYASYADGVNFSCKMTLDEVRIWNATRTQSQIQATMNNELVGTESNLKLYYNFNQGTAGGTNSAITTLTDRTTSAYTGTLNNFGLTGATSNWVQGYFPSLSYLWSNGATTQSITVGTSGSYTVQVTNANGCLSPSSAATVVTISESFIPGTISSIGETICYNGDPNPIVNNALAMDGQDDYAIAPARVWFNGNYTIETWIYPRTFSNWGRVIDFGNGPGVDNVLLGYTEGTSGKPSLVNFGAGGVGSLTSSTQLVLNQWSHLAVSFNGTTATMYINGALVATGTMTAPNNVNRTSCLIGKSNFGPGDPNANAIFDELRIWNVARSQAEIQASMNVPFSGSETGLQANYNFDQGIANGNNTSITTLTDRTSNSSHATLNNVALTGTNSNFVSGSPVTTNATGGSGTITYKWQANGVDIANSNATTYDPPAGLTATTTYRRFAKDESCSPNFTPSSGSYVVAVNALPTASISGNTSFCTGGNTVLNSNATAGSGTISSYQWKVGGVNVASAGTSATYTATAAGSYTVTVTNDKGCQSPASAATVVTVNALPTITASATATAVCQSTIAQNTSLDYSATSGIPTTYSISWTATPTNSFVALTDATLTTSPISIAIPANTGAGTYTGTLTVKNANGCVSAGTSFTVTVNALPTLSANSGGAASVCINSTTAAFTNAQTGGTWSIVAGTGTASVSTSGVVTGLTPGTVSVKYTYSNGICSNSENSSLTINALPTAPTITAGGVTAFCSGGSVVLTASAGTTYLWSNGATEQSNTVTTSGNYTVRVTNASGCQSAESVATVVSVNLNTANAASSTANLCINTLLTNITHSTSGSTGIGTASGLPAGITASWASNTITISGTPTLSGTFNYTIPLTGGCGSVNATGTIIVKTKTTSITNVSICPNQLPYNWNGSRSAAGNYIYTTTNSQGCDSIATLNLTIKMPTSSTDSITINASQLPYSWNGLTFNAAGTLTANLTNAAGCDSAATLTLSVTASTIAFHLKALLQGLYLGNGKMVAAPFNADGVSPMNIADTITVELRDTIQFNVIHTIKGLLDTAGNAAITFPGSVNGNSYYVVVGHRNSVAVWSANPVIFSTTTNYDFTNAITKAFGSNMAEDGGVFMLFSGDINQDGSIDFSDYPDLDISSSNGDLGYLPFDLNGDASVDFSDYPTLDINSSQGVLVVTP
jgi:hypothetical protein